MRKGTFFKSSKEIVCDFLNNVIAIDDNLFFDESKSYNSDLDNDFEFSEANDNGLGKVIKDSQNILVKPIDLISHPLNYQNLSLAFSEYGINCSAFKPENIKFGTIEAAAERIQKSTKRADITILDWSMDENFSEKPGTLAKLSIREILFSDKSMHGRLRLIVIYTGEPNPDDIAENIYESVKLLDESAVLNTRNINFKSSHFEFCQITVLEKDLDAAALRDEVIELFTELTIGLLPNATLSAIGELRDKTHHILHAFNRHLDPAYLSHVIGLLSSPQVREKSHEIAFDYATDLISEEFKSNLQISNTIKNNLGVDRLHDWVEHININNEVDFFEVQVGETNKVGINSERLKSLLQYTTDEDLINTLTITPPILKKDKKTLENFSKKKIYINLKNVNNLSHETLSAVECKRRDLQSLKPGITLPTIKQGSIVKHEDSYYICMQPLCDSVRIDKNTNFIFLKIEAVDAPRNFTHVVRGFDGEFIKFSIKPGSKDIHTFKLEPDTLTNTVKVVKESDQYIVKYFNASGDVTPLLWLGELKANVAQSIANKLAEQISRVGLDTNEWLRRL